ncbi:aminopeptidase N [Glaciecola petra]|uniref:Aminopeptidase N n=1 Tax=Glaciecola petra TaxID=3075602 RepID=A0ABU2ZPD8_9ALTE|nr:aminopeptidase N [Aestuariibacter sp. P117]MDT0594219.1 aminopeptidase N [Aestuariibacter sp. P117]
MASDSGSSLTNTDSEHSLSKKRIDYKAPTHLVPNIHLTFELDPNETRVKNVMQIRRVDNSVDFLVLDGEGLQLTDIMIDSVPLTLDVDFWKDEHGLRIQCNKDEFTLTISNTISPINNTSLEGLYFSNGAYCTQCEAEGFRKISYFFDRPDILSIYTVCIRTNDTSLSYLLSNGNLISDNVNDTNMRECIWRDPFPKPCYLFALVAGHFDKLEDKFVTMSGRTIELLLFVDEGRKGQGQHALDSLKKAMRWDEETYGLEYDLDIYMIVAVDFFNMGAMENKGLNVFNSKFVLADSNTATDEDYFNIESIIAHEYFHNWTGNRVTCRDWFQLSLKEGLTVFRDQQFSADMFSPLITRIGQVKVMREHQFAEDASPMSHPIRPDEVMEMNNFYTVTVYDKGAEVIRMLHTLLGKRGFRQGMDLYFKRHDGQAVTCDDFVQAMQDANDIDLAHFKLWYSQSGTPEISIELSNDEDNMCRIGFRQFTQATADQAHKQALYVPIKVQCLNADGKAIKTGLANDTFVLTDSADSILILGDANKITPVFLQDFSAPVKIHFDYSGKQLLNIILNANNHYSKWEATQQLFFTWIKSVYLNECKLNAKVKEELTTLAGSLPELTLPDEVLAQLMTLPSLESCIAKLEQVNPLQLNKAYIKVRAYLASISVNYMLKHYHNINGKNDLPYAYQRQQVNGRKLKNVLLFNIACSGNELASALIKQQFEDASNMTDKLGALKAAQVYNIDLFDALMLSFEEQYTNDAVVMDKWFALHASIEKPDLLSQLDLLQAHKQFSITNPNKVRSLIGSFAFYNTVAFHQADGSGYKYLADYLLQLDKVNPQVASRLITPLIQYSQLENSFQEKIIVQLQRLYGAKGLSKDLFEKISKCLISKQDEKH